MKPTIFTVIFTVTCAVAQSQSPLAIPPILEGPTFDLQVQQGTTQFWPGINTPTYGVNGNILAPTLVLHKGTDVELNVTNNLTTSTTMHWHGLHVSAMNDGGPHQSIAAGATWSPQFTVMNNAGTFWYHPHGENKTDLQVSRGIAGMIIVKDAAEEALELPRTYGVDDFPIIIQTKSFDVLHQIQIATHADTLAMVNATVNPYLDAPAQVVRLRVLNGSSERSYKIGFSNNMSFAQIATDGGLKAMSYETNRLTLAPGERTEILINLIALQGESFSLMNFGSELPNGIIGAQNVGTMATLPGYDENPLNGADYSLLQINVTAPTSNAITTVPTTLVEVLPWSLADVNAERTMLLSPMEMGMANMVEGPFGINNVQFNMDIVNEVIPLNNIEVWTISNQTQVAHPFHIHDVEFYILDVNGANPLIEHQGWKDVVLVMPMQSVSFITKFEDFADPIVPYMYHCHLLHHEDEGMMGSFTVVDPNNIPNTTENKLNLPFPNPALHSIHISTTKLLSNSDAIEIYDNSGAKLQVEYSILDNNLKLNTSALSNGSYTVKLNGILLTRFIVQK
jgi:blue copper oxidase